MKYKALMCLISSFLFFGTSTYAQMSDNQIIEYVKESIADGKSRSQIMGELMSKGCSSSQVARLIKAYQNGEYDSMTAQEKSKDKVSGNKIDRSRTNGEPDARQKKSDSTKSLDDNIKNAKSQDEEIKDKKIIFGHDIFNNKNLTFEPNENAATPPGYIIGPGDELIIDVWGENEVTLKNKISPEGNIIIPQIGPVQLSGLTIDKATSKLKSILSRIYSLSGSNPGSNISVTLGSIRTVKVNILGEVKTPGTYRLSAFSSIFNALYNAGGITEIGSLRNIKLIRNGKTIHTADLYQFIFNGTLDGSITLSDGDAIIVPPYSSLVQVTGGVKRPMYYEAVNGETVDKVIGYSGSFCSNAFSEEIIIHRFDSVGGKAYSVRSSQFASFAVEDGDEIVVNVNKNFDIIDNSVKISGAVARPGDYAIGDNVATLRQLVENAGGVLDGAFINRAQIIREKPDQSVEILAVPLGAIIIGRADDIILKKHDIVIVSDKNEMEPKGDVAITGYVNNPGDYKFAEGMTIEDLIMLAGGLEPGASTSKVEVSRRIIDPASLSARDTLATIFTFELQKNFSVQKESQFTLQPYDVVSVRKSPSYQAQSRVLVTGEATFPGEYTLLTNHDRLSDIFKRAGSSTPNSYIAGAILRRKMTDTEMNIRRITKQTASHHSKTDSLQIDSIPNFYSVGINLEKAISKPGSNYDVVLRDGDELIIPTSSTTVSIQGEVFYPNVVNYTEGMSVSYYVDMAGGFTTKSRRNKVFIVYMNGKVARGMTAKVMPGCEIVVPRKEEAQKLTTGEWIGIGTATASLATTIVSLMNLIKK